MEFVKSLENGSKKRMKAMAYLVLIFMLIITLSACNSSVNKEKSTSVDEVHQQTDKESSKLYVKGVGNVDVINSHGSIEGIERLQEFYNNTQNGTLSDIRIVRYTTEGDPMVYDLSYNGASLEFKFDSTRDTYGNGEIITDSCGEMILEVNPTNTTFIIADCKTSPFGMQEILQIQYNVSHQDLFELELDYGVNLENKINTQTNSIFKLINETEEDYIMSSEVKQEVYKRLVFANYLEEKNLDASCGSEDSVNYALKVLINGGQREFSWKDCDQSLDGVKFTTIAEYMIEQSEQDQRDNQQVMIQGYVLERKDNSLLIGEDLTKFDYELLKDEMPQIDFDAYVFDFTELEGENLEEFLVGDKIQATIEGVVVGSNPGRATVKNIKKID